MNQPQRIARVFPGLILAALVFAVYWNTLSGEFVYDDKEQIVENTWITDSKYLPSIFSSHSFGFAKDKELGTTYRPLVFSVYMAEHYFFGLDPKGWHAVNVFFHAINAVLVFVAASLLLKGAGARKTEGLPPFAAAVLFALHPVNSEVVAWVGCVPELVYTMFCLGAFCLYMKSRDGARLPFTLNFASALLFFIAMFAKETAIALPALVFAYDLFVKKDGPVLSAASIKRYVPYAAFIVMYFIIRLSALGGMAPRENMYPYLGLEQYLLNAAVLFVKYARVLLLPVNDYPFPLLDPVFSLAEPRAFIPTALILAAVPLFFLLRKRMNPLYWLSAAFIVLPVLPALYLPGLSRAPFADRYLYLPSMGFAIILAAFLKNGLERAASTGSQRLKAAAIAVFVLVSALYAAGSGLRNLRWKDEFSLWNSSLKGVSDEYKYYAYYQLGTAALRKNMHGEAVPYLKKAISVSSANRHPDPGVIGDSRLNLAYAYSSMGLPDEAAGEYLELLKAYPGHAVSNYELASIYMEKGMLDEAAEYFTRAAGSFRDPLDVKDALVGAGNCLARMGDYEEAYARYQQALRVMPGDTAALRNLKVLEGLRKGG